MQKPEDATQTKASGKWMKFENNAYGEYWTKITNISNFTTKELKDLNSCIPSTIQVAHKDK